MAQVGDEIHQRLMQYAQVSRLGRPIVFLQVDVAGVVAAPRGKQAFVPQALQVGGHTGCTRTGNEQVTSVLEIKHFQLRIALVLIGIFQKLPVGRQGGNSGIRFAQIQFHTVEEMLIIGHMCLAQRLITLLRSFRHALCHQVPIVPSFLDGVFVKTVKAGDVGYQDERLLSSVNLEFARRIALHLRRIRSEHLDEGAEMNATLRVVEVFVLHQVEINRIGMIGGIAIGRDFVSPGRRGMRKLGIEGQQRLYAFGTVTLKANHNHGVGGGSKIIGLHPRAIFEILRTGCGVTDVQPSPVGSYLGTFAHIAQGQRAQGLIIFAIMPLHLALFAVRTPVILLVQQVAYHGNGLVSVGSGDGPVRLARP